METYAFPSWKPAYSRLDLLIYVGWHVLWYLASTALSLLRSLLTASMGIILWNSYSEPALLIVSHAWKVATMCISLTFLCVTFLQKRHLDQFVWVFLIWGILHGSFELISLLMVEPSFRWCRWWAILAPVHITQVVLACPCHITAGMPEYIRVSQTI